MKKKARITSKGQITIPLEIRRALNVGPGDHIEFVASSSGVRVRAVSTDANPFERYRGIGTPGIGRGRDAVLGWMRDLRGHDDSD